MPKLYILGENSFLGSSFYIFLKKHKLYDIYLLSHNEYEKLINVQKEDIIINFCGVNRSDKQEDYEYGNYLFLKNILTHITCKPFLIHVSSLMVYGFHNKNIDELNDYQKWFITTKLNGEEYLKNNYPIDKLSIVRPSNIYGYRCKPYYNNLLSTMIYEKIKNKNKINKINRNCVRNMLSIDNFCKELLNIVQIKEFGIFNILSQNNISLSDLSLKIYDNNIPENIALISGNDDIPNLDNVLIPGKNKIIYENIDTEIKNLETNMAVFLKLQDSISILNLQVLSQPRGDMVEISSLESKRLYKITFTEHSVRGNHYHYEQIEEFYTNNGNIIYLLAYADFPDIILFHKSKQNDLIKVLPNVIHTLCNDFLNNTPEIIIGSTQKYIKDNVPDTKYINIV